MRDKTITTQIKSLYIFYDALWPQCKTANSTGIVLAVLCNAGKSVGETALF